jgi:hypothetical protein
MSLGHPLAQRSAQAETSPQLGFATLATLAALVALGLPTGAGCCCSTGV